MASAAPQGPSAASASTAASARLGKISRPPITAATIDRVARSRAGSPAPVAAAAQLLAAAASRASGGTQYAPSEKPWPSIPNAQLKRDR